jgi:hypothetical protein
MRKIFRRAICSSVVVRDRRRRGEVALVDSATNCGSSCGVLMLVGGGCSRESCSGSEFRREGNFPESKLSDFCSGSIGNMHSTSANRFSCSGGILFTQSTLWVLISCCFVMTGAFFYQSCLVGDRVLQNF